MVEAILKDKKKILPCSVFLQGEYGVNDLFVGVPVKLGARGVEQIIEIKLTPDEKAAFKKSAAAVKELDRRHQGLICPSVGVRRWADCRLEDLRRFLERRNRVRV